MPQTIHDEVRNFEARLGLPTGFYSNLLREDDWSFVIKLNAMFEGACTHVLAERLHAPEISGALAQLDFANTKFGKVALLCVLGAITSEQETVLRKLAELRNDLVHNIAKINFSFESYVGAMDKNQFKTLVKNFGHGVSDSIEIANERVPKDKFVRENPKVSLWLTAAEILACLSVEFKVAELHLKTLALSELQELTAPISPPH
ncbi:MAG: hypothetical protein JSR30_08280 [Proteobacteria bacterium]|nr:hypothetical protein [Pseudomonadota bacterium]